MSDAPVPPGPPMPAPGPSAGGAPPPGTQPVGPGPAAYPYAAPQPYGLAPGSVYGGPEAGPGAPGESAALRKARIALGWAIGAAVVASLAAVAAIVAFLVSMSNTVDGLGDGYAIDARLVDFHSGSDVDGYRMETAVTDALSADGSTGIDITCPETAKLRVSSTVVCTGTFDGSDNWVLVVYVVDDTGSLLVTEY